MTDAGRSLTDTDWHVDRLYAFADAMGATTVKAGFSRYVIDVNRDPSGRSLYPGQATTGLCPTTTFAGEPLYLPGEEPDAAEIEERRRNWFDAYHQALAAQAARLKERFGTVLLYDCHSIRSVVPRLFPGTLPVLNLGTNEGRSCSPRLREKLTAIMAASGLTHVADGRFKGGWITRHYGDPASGVEAVQMELAQAAYMDEDPPWPYRADLAASLEPTLRRLLETMLAFGERR
ncbi:MAG: N-formylglutamate deformylase [Geminicoccaceae bacterium]